MVYTFLILVAFIPVFLWVKYLHERTGTVTPFNHLVPAFLAGSVICYPAFVVENFLISLPSTSFAWLQNLALVRAVTFDGQFADYFLRAFVLGGFVEELLKLMAVLAILWAYRKTVRPVSLIVMAVAVGGTFGAVENILFSLHSENLGRVATLRALISLPHHVFLGVIMGFFLVCAWKLRRWRYPLSCLAFAVPALLHGTANFALAVGAPELDSPGVIEALGRQFYGYVLMTEAVITVMILARTSWLASAAHGERRAKVSLMGRRYLSLRRAFWAQIALIIGVFGFINLLTIAASLGEQAPGFNMRSSFIIGAMSLLYALLIWGHARRPAVAPSSR